MHVRILVLLSIVTSMIATAKASDKEIGTPDQRREAIAACGPDARLYCKALKEADGAYAYLACLELNRNRLTMRCITLLVRYGQ